MNEYFLIYSLPLPIYIVRKIKITIFKTFSITYVMVKTWVVSNPSPCKRIINYCLRYISIIIVNENTIQFADVLSMGLFPRTFHLNTLLRIQQHHNMSTFLYTCSGNGMCTHKSTGIIVLHIK